MGAAASGIRPGPAKCLSVPAHISVAKPVSGPAALRVLMQAAWMGPDHASEQTMT